MFIWVRLFCILGFDGRSNCALRYCTIDCRNFDQKCRMSKWESSLRMHIHSIMASVPWVLNVRTMSCKQYRDCSRLRRKCVKNTGENSIPLACIQMMLGVLLYDSGTSCIPPFAVPVILVCNRLAPLRLLSRGRSARLIFRREVQQRLMHISFAVKS